MAKQHGRGGKLFVDVAGGGSASLVTHLNKWTFAANQDIVEVTDFDDSNKTYVAGFSDAKGTFAGFYDDATPQTYTAAQDGVARKFYMYPNKTGTPGQYFYGTAFFDFNISGGTAQAVDLSGSWSAATGVFKVG